MLIIVLKLLVHVCVCVCVTGSQRMSFDPELNTGSSLN